jgi:DNA-binding MarR family transcriptional regulator
MSPRRPRYCPGVQPPTSGQHQRFISGGRGGNVALDLFVLSQHLGELLDKALKESGLSPAQYAVYSQVASGPSSPKALLKQLGLRPATLSGYLNAMQARGDLARAQDPPDRRAHVVSLTASGAHRHAIARQAFREVLSAVNQQLGGRRVTPQIRAELFRIDHAITTVLDDQ